MRIESNQNAKYKNWLKLKKKKYRLLEQEFLVEGAHLVEEAIQSGNLKEILVREGALIDEALLADRPVYTLKASLFDKLAATPSPQPLMATCRINPAKISSKRRLLLLDEIQDPGNLGTLIRSAAAFGFEGIILGEGCVDVYNEKTIRATQGALFKVAMEQRDLAEAISEFSALGVKVYGTRLESAQPLGTVESTEKMAFLLGNEGSGVKKELLDLMAGNIFIEMQENVESLNVSIAGSVIMYRFRL